MLKIYGDERSSRPKNEKTGSWKASGSVDSGRRELQFLDVLVAADEQLVGDEPARAGRVFRVNGRNVHHGVVGGQFFEGEPCIAADADDVAARFERRGRRLVGEERRAVVLGVVVIVGPRDRQPLVLVVLVGVDAVDVFQIVGVGVAVDGRVAAAKPLETDQTAQQVVVEYGLVVVLVCLLYTSDAADE